jgi:hypothetical protein
MTRNEAIRAIDSLYPADAVHPVTAKIGRELLEQAKREVNGWRNEPDDVLIRYAELCIEEERRPARDRNRNPIW